MSHSINYLEFSLRKQPKTILKECKRIADVNGDYKGQIENIRFNGYSIMKNRDEAEKWIKDNDSGWYDNLAIRFKDNDKVKWLVKIEYHC